MNLPGVLARPLPPLVLVLAAIGLLLTLAPAALAYDAPPEDYAAYEPQKKCRKATRPGTVALATWIDGKYAGGPASAAIRPCESGGASEHKDGRAIDWTMDATKKQERREVKRFLEKLFQEDRDGNAHALARRMGVMYVIWNDHLYASYRQFTKADYLSGGCRSLEKCPPTLRHRDHVHISLSKAGAKGQTSWYAGRL